jgi:hypothetical protein
VSAHDAGRWLTILELADERAILGDRNEEPLAGIVFESVPDALAFVRWTGDNGHTYRFASERSRREQTSQYARERGWPECASGGCTMRVDGGAYCDSCVEEHESAPTRVCDSARDAAADELVERAHDGMNDEAKKRAARAFCARENAIGGGR